MVTRQELQGSLRERKRAKTRRALIDAAVELFDRQGYEQTTVAQIAAAAEISTRTFFGYFASKEDLLFPDSQARVQAALDAIDQRRPGDRPVEVLLRALEHVAATDADMISPLASVRVRLIQTVPSVQGRGLQVLFSAQRDIARHLLAAFPSELDETSSAALVGALVGSISATIAVLMEDPAHSQDPDRMRAEIGRAAQIALQPWLTTRDR
jgi:AcrR family transcriptional regulator